MGVEKGSMFTRKLGKSGIEVSAMGLGCWAIGGPWELDGRQVGWSKVDDNESIRAIHRAIDLGINFFDTAACYGAGHSERILGKAVADKRDRVVIATKFGHLVNEEKKTVTGKTAEVTKNLRQYCEDSLCRLDTKYIDLYQFHFAEYPLEEAFELKGLLEDLVVEGKIRAYGWSTDHVENARMFAEGEHCAAIQFGFNILADAPEMLATCDEFNLGGVNRNPLQKGLLTGKFSPDATFPEDDIRHSWNLKSGSLADNLSKLDKIREVLTQGGRTLAQGALAWIWARHERTIPIPGFKTVSQVEENVGALAAGPLSGEQMEQIDALLGRTNKFDER
jgi:aryl-alcohol dehydrogenase-like predicted oxidoreductase